MTNDDPSTRAKHAAARAAAAWIEDGMRVGLGSGSTAAHFVRALGERVRSGLAVRAVCTSNATESLARTEGITVDRLDHDTVLDIAIDGADAVDPALALVKGFGGALFREKMIALAAKRFVVIVDRSKIFDDLARVDYLPVEVLRFGAEATARRIESLGVKLEWRLDGTDRYLTDNDAFIAKVRPAPTSRDAARIASSLKSITGVIEHGLFVHFATDVIIGNPDGSTEHRRA